MDFGIPNGGGEMGPRTSILKKHQGMIEIHSLAPDFIKISKAQPVLSPHLGLVCKVRVFYNMTSKDSFSFETSCSMVLKPRESPGCVIKD